MTQDESERAAKAFVREVMRRCGIHVETFRDGTLGLVNVPAKYASAIDAMHSALFSVLVGDGLPAFTPEEPKAKRTRRTG